MLNFATKIPAVGPSIEATMIASSYLQNTGKIQAKQHRLKTIKRGLVELKREGSRFSCQEDHINDTIDRLKNQLLSAEDEVKQEGRNAFKKASMVILQEGAGAIIPGGGSLVAGVVRASEAIFEDSDRPLEGLQEGAKECLQDYGFSLATEQFCETAGCVLM